MAEVSVSPIHASSSAPVEEVKEKLEVVAPTLPQAERVDKFLISRTKLSRSALQRLFEQNRVLVNGTVCKKSYKVKSKDVFTILVSTDSGSKELQGVDHALDIVYEDEYLLVLNKEPGMAVHPGQGEEVDAKVTLVHALIHRYGRQGLSAGENAERPGIVHRLDKDTSGLMIVCKTDEVHAAMKDMFQKRHDSLTKTYWALVLGKVSGPSSSSSSSNQLFLAADMNNTSSNSHKTAPSANQDMVTIDTPLMRNPASKQGHKMIVAPFGDPKAKPALTKYRVLKQWTLQKQQHYSLLEVQIETGRTHQIRVHLSSQAHPIVGDALYAAKHNNHQVPYLLLTSKSLQFQHPITKQNLSFSIDLPPHFAKFSEKLDQLQQTFEKTALAQSKKGKKANNPYEQGIEDLLI